MYHFWNQNNGMFPTTYIHDIFQVFFRLCFLGAEFGDLEVDLLQHVSAFGAVPAGPGDLHQPVPQQQHQQEQTPRVAGCDSQHLQLGPEQNGQYCRMHRMINSYWPIDLTYMRVLAQFSFTTKADF